MRTYSLSTGWKWFSYLVCPPLTLCALAGVWYFSTGHGPPSAGLQAAMAALCLAMALYMAYVTARTFIAKVLVLRSDALVLPGLLRDKVIPRSRILGYRIRPVKGVDVLEIRFRHPGGSARSARVEIVFKRDAAFKAWFAAFPDIDAADLAASIQEVRQDARLGGSPNERLKKVAQAREFGVALNVLLVVSSVWAIFYPRPYLLAVAVPAFLPVLALWLCWRHPGLFSIDDAGKKTARAELPAVLIAPGFILSLRALQDVQLLQPMQLLLPACAGLVLVMTCILWIAPAYRSRLGTLLLASLLMAAYPAGVLALANTEFDHAVPQRRLLAVLDKHVTRGKRRSYILTLQPWSPLTAAIEAEVTPALYQQSDLDQNVCLVLSVGALGWAWYVVEPVAACAG